MRRVLTDIALYLDSSACSLEAGISPRSGDPEQNLPRACSHHAGNVSVQGDLTGIHKMQHEEKKVPGS